MPELEVSMQEIDEKLVGNLHYALKNVNITDLLKNGNKEIFDIQVNPHDIIEFPNNQIIFSIHINKCLALMDQNLNLVKIIDRIDNETFAPLGIAINKEEKRFYISDSRNNRIIMTNLEFKKIKSIGSKGKENNQFDRSSDLCFRKDNLYVCDYLNKRVQVYTSELEYVKTLRVGYNPWKIKASDVILCVEAGDQSPGIHFYNLIDLSLYKKYEHGVCRLSEINSCFYELSHVAKKVYFYDEMGNLKDEILLNGMDKYLQTIWDGTFIHFNGSLLMNSYYEKKIIKFSKN